MYRGFRDNPGEFSLVNLWSDTVCLVEYVAEEQDGGGGGGGPRICERAVAKLELRETVPLLVLGLCGPFREGVSKLYEKLRGQILPAAESDSLPRILACHGPSPGKGSHSLLLLIQQGEEGLDDQGKAVMYTILSLLSNVLIFSSYKHIDQPLLDSFRFMRYFRDDVAQVRSMSPSPDTYDYTGDPECRLHLYSPAFIWVTWDMTPSDLVLVPGTPAVKSQEYMERKIQLNKGNVKVKGGNLNQQNQPRILLRKYFQEKKCYILQTEPEEEKDKDSAIGLKPVRKGKSETHDMKKLYWFIKKCNPKSVHETPLKGPGFARLITAVVNGMAGNHGNLTSPLMDTMSASEEPGERLTPDKIKAQSWYQSRLKYKEEELSMLENECPKDSYTVKYNLRVERQSLLK